MYKHLKKIIAKDNQQLIIISHSSLDHLAGHFSLEDLHEITL